MTAIVIDRLVRQRRNCILGFAICLFTADIHAQLVAWDFSGKAGNETTVTSTTTASGMNSSTIGRGGGVLANSLANTFSANDYTAIGSRTLAILNDEYFQFGVSAASGAQFSLSTLDANFRRSSTGPKNFEWQYSLDGFATDGVTIGSSFTYTLTTSNGDAQTQISLSSISALQSVSSGTTVTFRLYGWNASATTGTFALGRPTTPANDLAIGGTASFPPLYWDLSPGSAGIGGAGPATWDTTSSNWNSVSAGTGANTTYSSANTALFGGADGSPTNQVNIISTGVTANVGVQFDSNGYVIAGTGSLTLGTTPTVTVTTAAHTATINAGITGSTGLTKSGAGKLVLGGANNYTGNTTVTAGTLSVSADSNLGNSANDVAVSGGALEVTNNLSMAAGRDLTGTGGNLDVAPTKTLTVNGTVNTGSLGLTNTGAVVLAGASNTMTGLGFTADGSLDAGGNTITLNGDLTTSNASGEVLIDGVLAFGSASRNITVGDGSGAADLGILANITGSNRLIKLGAGVLELAGDNSGLTGASAGFRIGSSGVTPAAGGTVVISDKNALGTGGTVQFNNGTISSTSALTGANALPIGISLGAPDTVNSGNGAVLAGSDMEFTAATSIFRTTGVSQYKLTVQNTTKLTGAFVATSGSGTSQGLTVGGAGTLIIANATNAFELPVTVDGATVAVNGTMTSSLATFAVKNAARLQGTGTISGAVTLGDGTTGGTLAPGNSAGKFTISSALTIQSGILSTTEIEFIGTSGTPVEVTDTGTKFDFLSVSGTLTLGGSRLNIVVPGGADSIRYNTAYVIATAGSVGGVFGKLNDQVVSTQYRGSYPHYDVKVAGTTIEITFVPEPTSAAVLVGSGMLAMRRRRRV